MRVLGIDFETTGVDTQTAHITEVGAVLWETDTNTPLELFSTFVYEPSYETEITPAIAEMMKTVCGLTPEMIKEFGVPNKMAIEHLRKMVTKGRSDYIVCHNGTNYDRPVLKAALQRYGLESAAFDKCIWVDTMTDLPFVTPPESRKLKHIALDLGFINPFPHRAVTDVLTMLKVMSNFEFSKIVDLAKQPMVVMRALTGYDQRELAKAARYSWEKLGDKTYTKMWVKNIKEGQTAQEIENCKKAGFQSVRIA